VDQARPGPQACLRFTNWSVHLGQPSPFVGTKRYRSVSGFDLNTTMHYIGGMYVGNKPAAFNQTTSSRWMHFRHYVLIAVKYSTCVTLGCVTLGERTEGYRCPSFDGSRWVVVRSNTNFWAMAQIDNIATFHQFYNFDAQKSNFYRIHKQIMIKDTTGLVWLFLLQHLYTEGK
jgi:hypothetical protein